MGAFQKMKYDTVIDGANIGFSREVFFSERRYVLTNFSGWVTRYLSGRLSDYSPASYRYGNCGRKDSRIKENKIPMFVVSWGDDDCSYFMPHSQNSKSLLVTNDEMRNHSHYMNF